VVDELRQGARLATAGVGLARGRRALVVAEVALAIVVLAAAGVLVRSFANIYNVAQGFRSERVLALRVSNVEGHSGVEGRQPIDRLVTMIEAIPGVEGAGATVGVPFSHGAGADDFEVDGRPPALDGGRPEALMQAATPRYFETLGIPLLRGRAFTDSDDAGSAPVAIVNRALAERVFPGEDAVGRGLVIDGTRWEVVGLVGDVFHGDVEAIREPEIYRPMRQWSISRVWIAVRTREDRAALGPALVATVGRFDPDMVITRMLTVDELRAGDMGSERRRLRLMGAFATAAILITAIGLYGVVSYSAAQRTREFGVRLALGAGRGVVLRMVLADGLRLATLGAGLGILGALAALPVMRAMLFGVSPSDPVTLAAVAAIVCGIGLLAAYVPARRATRVDPVAWLSEG
jgi:putative ABC transport system permease protein